MPGLDDIGDLAGEILADPRQLRQIASGFQQASGRFRQTLDDACGTAVGAHAKLVLPPDLKEFGGLVEHGGDFRILHGHGRDPRKPDFVSKYRMARQVGIDTDQRQILKRTNSYTLEPQRGALI